jgi:hypothetical protein
MLSNTVANLKDRAKRLEFQIQGSDPVSGCQIIEQDEAIGDYVWEKTETPRCGSPH